MAEFDPIKLTTRNGREFIIRHGMESDAIALIEFAHRCIEDGEGQVMVPGEFKMTEEKEREWIKSLREDPNELLLVALADSEIIGNIDFHIGKRQRTCHAGMFGMSVHKDWRSQGVGFALLSELVKWATSRPHIEKIGLRVLANNLRAINLYKKLGFQQEGYSPKVIKLGSDEYVDDIQMGLLVKEGYT